MKLSEAFGEDFCDIKLGNNITLFIVISFEGLSNDQASDKLIMQIAMRILCNSYSVPVFTRT